MVYSKAEQESSWLGLGIELYVSTSLVSKNLPASQVLPDSM